MGTLEHGQLGAGRSAERGAINWVQTLLRGRPQTLEDLAYHTRKSAAQELWLIVIDASASTRRYEALSDAKGLLAQLFDDAYRQRTRIAVMTASGSRPHWHISGGKASKALDSWLQSLGAGGGTPLLEAIEEVASWLTMRRKQFPQEQQRFLLVTDGRLKEVPTLPALDCPGLLVDIERGPIRLGRALTMSAALNIEYRHIDALN
ncbi:VWA domain-containing protein [Pseudomonas sp. SIMBA_077]